MFRRLAADRLHALAAQFPAVVVLGPRQVGKTTFVRQALPGATYCDLEDPATRARFDEDPRLQLDDRARDGALVLDEAQAVPAIFSALRGAIDAHRERMGRFIVLGSAQPAVVRHVAESLAGRAGVIELEPLTASEAATGPRPREWREMWLCGGFPDALTASERGGSFRDWWESYLRTFVERDLALLGLSIDPRLMRRLLTMLAHAQGGMANLSQLAGALGVAQGTVRRYVDILEATFLVRRLSPYFKNIGKRLVKAPKLYLRDTGLLHHLLNIGTHEALDTHPGRGASFETFVLEDLIRRERLGHPYSGAYFWRTAAGSEADLLIEREGRLHAIEIKAGRHAAGHATRVIRSVREDIAPDSFTVIDQAPGEELVSEGIRRRHVASSLDWLP